MRKARGGDPVVRERRRKQRIAIANFHIILHRTWLSRDEVLQVVQRCPTEITIVMQGLEADTGIRCEYSMDRKKWVFGGLPEPEPYKLTNEQKKIRKEILINLGT